MPALFALVLSGAAGAAHALTYLPMADGDLADQASAIAEIDVLSKQAAPGTQLPMTDYTVLVERVIKGSLDSTATIRVLGGERDGQSFIVPGAPAFGDGDHALVFLARHRDGTFGITQFALGAFHRIETDANGALAVRDLGEAFTPARTEQPLEPRERDYDRFAAWLADRARGARRAADYMRSVPPEVSQAIVERFRLFIDNGLNYRWFEFDDGGSVGWTFNADRSDDPDRDRGAFQRALSAWDDDPGSNVNYAFLGDGPADTFPDSNDVNGVTFGDPFNHIDGSFDCSKGGTLAVGGVLSDGSSARFRGRLYRRILEGGIVVQDGIDCELDTDPALIAEILTHELGHTLGIDHSCGDQMHCSNPALDDATMRAMVHDDGRDASLADDDRRAAAALYPGVGGGTAGGGGGNGGGTAALAAPSDVAADAISPTEARVTWTDTSNGERNFRVQIRNGRRWVDAGVAPANATELVVGNLASGSTVHLRVRAEARRIASAWSEVVVATLP